MAKTTTFVVLAALLLPCVGLADPPGGSWLQLDRLNQQKQHELARMQRAYIEQRPTAPTLHEQDVWQRLQRQHLEQRALQQDQQHQRLIQAQQRRVRPYAPGQRLDGLFQQQRFRQAQERQLNRFQLQQQRQSWAR